MNERDKLTGSAGDRYDGRRGKNMPDGPSRTPENNPINPKQEKPAILPEAEAGRGERSFTPERTRETRQEGILQHLTGAPELVEASLSSHREKDQVVGFMLFELNEFTRQQPLREVEDQRLAVWYDEWRDYSENYLKAEPVSGKPVEEIRRDAQIEKVAAAVKNELLLAAKDKDAVKGEFLLREINDDKTPQWKEIKNAAVKNEVLQLKDSLDRKKIKNISEWRQEVARLRTLENEYIGSISRDPDAKAAINRLHRKLDFMKRDMLSAMRYQEPPKTPTIKEKKEKKEFSNPEVKQSSDELLAIADRATETISKLRAHQDLNQGEYTRIERDQDAKEAQKKWSAEKKRMKKLTGEKGFVVAELIKHQDDWSKYGWSLDNKKEVAKHVFDITTVEEFNAKRKSVEAISRALLLDGLTGEGAVQFLEKTGQEVRQNSRYGNLGSFFANDKYSENKDVLMALGMTEDEANRQITQIQDQKYDKRPGHTEELAWQIAYKHQDTFGENGDHPAWERKVRMTASFGENKEGEDIIYSVNERGFRVDEEGNLLNKFGKRVGSEQEAEPAKGSIKLRVHEVVNKNNVLLWQRERTNYLHSQNPNEGINFYEKVKLEKGGYYSVPIDQMFEGEESIFRGDKGESVPWEFMSEDLKKTLLREGKDHLPENFHDLSTQMQIEAYLLTMVRQFHLAYDQNKGDDEELQKQLAGYFDRNHFTKEVWGKKSLWNFMATLPDDFTELDQYDGAVGGAVIDSYLAYYHMSDFDELEKSLGKDSKLFNLKKIIEVRDRLQKQNAKDFGSFKNNDLYYDLSSINATDNQGNPLLDEHGEEIVEKWKNSAVDKAFNPDGTIKNKKEYIKLVNLFNKHEKETMWRNVVETIIKEEASTEKINDINRDYAYLISTRLVRWTGAGALNDTDFVGYDASTRMQHGEGYRAKLLKDSSSYDTEIGADVHKNRGGDAGNFHTIPQYRSFVVNPMLGIVTEAEGKSGKKPILMVLEELHKTRKNLRKDLEREAEPHIDTFEKELREKHANDQKFHDEFKGRRAEERIKELAREMALEKAREEMGGELDKYHKEYRENAAQLHFTENAEQSYMQNHWNRGRLLYKIIRGAEGINFEQYWGYSLEVGVTFDRKKFQEDVIKKMITPTRYAFSTYGNLDYTMMIRGYDVSQERWRDMPLGESMFGNQLVDREEFWKKDENGKWAWKKVEVLDGEGNVVRDEHGKPKLIELKGQHETDWSKVQKNKVLLFKQWLMTYFAGEFIAARQMRKWSTDPRKDFHYYEQAIDVLSKIPGDFEGDSNDMNKINIKGHFFGKEEIGWLRKTSGTTKNKLYGMAALKALTLGKLNNEKTSVASGLEDAFQNFVGAIFQGF